MDSNYSFPKHKIKILLLEKIHTAAEEALSQAGYSVECVPRALSADELRERIADVHVLGVRSKTSISAEHIQAGRKLLAIGCFGVGTNHVALAAAALAGVPVFNAPYANTRSVAELTVCNVISLVRRVAEQSAKMHQGVWEKSAVGAYEVRDKVLGIIGYGHIGQQVSILAESLGLQVVFYDLVKKLPLGNSRQLASQNELLKAADIVTLHVPAMPDNRILIGADELAGMKQGSYLINLARGSLVDLQAVKQSLDSAHLAGAAFDVFPTEPKSNDESFTCELSEVPNVILTPHIGGSTEEAQRNIGRDVASAFIKFIDSGSTSGAVNFPELEVPMEPKGHRILNIHKNVPGVLGEVNTIISDCGANINAQFLNTHDSVGYLVMDINKEVSNDVHAKICSLASNIRTRILY